MKKMVVLLCAVMFVFSVVTLAYAQTDAKAKLKAMKPKLVLVSARMQSAYGKPVQKVLQELDPEVSILILDENFATQDPGEAAQELLNRIGSPEQKTS